jgi:hypothetical protein
LKLLYKDKNGKMGVRKETRMMGKENFICDFKSKIFVPLLLRLYFPLWKNLFAHV